ncbi:MAG: CSLREA domain-containing protein [Armatimonadetes bacterium]|nr:CSLREA domain-containing protein [Anaerolineae bacterium]
MNVWRILTLNLLLALLIMSSLNIANATKALAPTHDSWAERTVITALSFRDVQTDISAATVEPTDPTLPCRTGAGGQGAHTVWYGYTTGVATEYITLTTRNSDYDTILSVYTGTPGALTLVAGGCNDDGITDSSQSLLAGLRLLPETEYAIQVAAFNPLPGAATLNFRLQPARLYSISKTADTADGICDRDCSLREAISAANLAPGVIMLPGGSYRLTLPGADDDANLTGDLDITTSLAIYGAGAGITAINADGIDRALHMDPLSVGGYTVILADMLLTNGVTDGDGGALSTGINTNDFISLEQVAVAGNSAGQQGGGLHISGRALIRSSTISGNRAGSNGGGIALNGTSDVSVVVEYSTISGNRAATGGGVYTTSRLRLENATVSGNQANSAGGGVYSASGSALQLTSITVVNNWASDGGGLHLNGAAHLMVNSILADNHANADQATDCAQSGGQLISSYNHVEQATGRCVFQGIGDIVGSDPAVDSLLANNGGATLTHALLPGSPAIDAGNPAGCIDIYGTTLPVDQRGLTRQFDGDGDGTAACDKGAYEVEQFIMPSPTRTPTPPATVTPSPVPPTPEPLPTPDGYELVVNGGFETDIESDRSPDEWILKTTAGGKLNCNKPDKIFALEGACVYQFKGARETNSKLAQEISLAGLTLDAGDTLALSGYINAQGTVDTRLTLRVTYTDDTLATGKITLKQETPTDGYQSLISMPALSLTGTVASVRVQIQDKSSSGRVRVDAISVRWVDNPPLLSLPQSTPTG